MYKVQTQIKSSSPKDNFSANKVNKCLQELENEGYITCR
jgi:hypothetical protein